MSATAVDGKRLGVVVIGQSPRPEIVAQLRKFIGQDVAIEVRGALDGMSRAGIDAIRPVNGYDTLFTRLPDGEAVKISKEVVERRAKLVIEDFDAQGVTATMLCCTGDFPTLEGRHVVVLPSAVLAGIVLGLLPKGRLGLFVPLPDQIGKLDGKWQRDGGEILSVALTPGSLDATIDRAATEMQALLPHLVVMDCMSYTQATKDRIRQILRAPVILAITSAARIVGELLA